MDTSMEDLFGPVISSYTREEAINDGQLVDVTKTAKEAGIIFPVALTRAVYEECVLWTAEDSSKQTHQDESGRLWDVLYMLKVAISAAQGSCDHLDYCVYVVPRDGKSQKSKCIELSSYLRPGDRAEPVITIQMPNES